MSLEGEALGGCRTLVSDFSDACDWVVRSVTPDVSRCRLRKVMPTRTFQSPQRLSQSLYIVEYRRLRSSTPAGLYLLLARRFGLDLMLVGGVRSLHESGGRVQRDRGSGGDKPGQELVFQSISSNTILEWEFNRSNWG